MADTTHLAMQLLLRQYETLRREIEGFIQEQGQLATYGVIATGVVWSAVLTQSEVKTLLVEHPRLHILLFVPLLLAMLFFYRIIKLDEHIQVCSEHLAKVEATFGLAGKDWGTLAWEGFWRRRRVEGQQGDLRDWHRTYWICLCLLNFLAAAVVSWVYSTPQA